MIKNGTILTIPGWNGSGPEHWQSIWEAANVNFRRVEQREWCRPSREDWTGLIERAVRSAVPPIILVAHSLGCVATAHWAAGHDAARVAGALLVAPPWLTFSDACPEELRSFLPMPIARLPFHSVLVASENDPYMPIEIAPRLARSWGAEFVNAGRQGHINVASGHGPWPAGERLLESFCDAFHVSSADHANTSRGASPEKS
jgi:predicted alpha/beta hydrolase family esterase